MKSILPVNISDNSQDADYDEIYAYQIIKDLGENHHNKAENQAGYAHPKTYRWQSNCWHL
jgi:hypothetical protein